MTNKNKYWKTPIIAIKKDGIKTTYNLIDKFGNIIDWKAEMDI